MSENLPDLKDVITKVRELAAANPDYVYKMPDTGYCQYTFNGQGSCIVGQAYLELGVPVERVESWDFGSEGRPLGADQLVEREYDDYSLTDKEWLDNVQGFQDADKPWGEAVRKADERIGALNA